MFNSPIAEGISRPRIAAQWVQMAAADDGMLAALLLVGCRSRLAATQYPTTYSTEALRYRIQTISSVREELSQDVLRINDTTIAKTLVLALEAVSCTQVRISYSLN